MFRWLWEWVARVLFRIQDRRIFSYWDGSRWRRIDPMLALRQLNAHPKYRADLHPALADTGQEEAIDITLGAARDVFAVQAFDVETCAGLTQAETLGLMVDFAVYIGSLKKSTSPSPTLPPPTDLPQPSEPDKSPTSCSAGSGSTGSESSSDRPA